MADSYNLTVSDASPLFVYLPHREGEDLNTSWKSFFADSPDSSYDTSHQKDNVGAGQSLHSTMMQGAGFDISFTGTAIDIFGSGTAGAYTTSLDGGDAAAGDPSDGKLASYAGLEYKGHTLSLKLTQAQQLNVSSATITEAVKGTSIKEFDIAAVGPGMNSDGTPALNSTYFSMNNPGTFSTIHDRETHPRVDTTAAGSILYFHTTNAVAIFVFGSVNYDHGTYFVSMTGSGGDSSGTLTFNGTSKWLSYDNLIYWASGLDRTQTYQIALQNLEQGKYFDVAKVRIVDAEGASKAPANNTGSADGNGSGSNSTTGNGGSGTGNNGSSSSGGGNRGLSTGALAGIAAGGGVFAILILALLFFCCRRRGKGSQSPLASRDAKYSPVSTGHIVPFMLNSDRDSDISPSRSRFDSFSSSSHIRSFTNDAGTSQSYGYKGRAQPFEAGTFTSSQILPSGMDSRSHIPSPLGKAAQRASPSSLSSPLPSPPPIAATSSSTRTPTIRHETDAGPLPVEDEVVLPPNYNPAWSHGQS
ncbi:hypothetical protein VNI00_010531 [Paramarasmius palmivorus]|uniref:Uncharacterized protein n=1 Tax=Paramarasmius palmivorus TaxID=297713 RepID=A0AAW0CJC8_9AGAR